MIDLNGDGIDDRVPEALGALARVGLRLRAAFGFGAPPLAEVPQTQPPERWDLEPMLERVRRASKARVGPRTRLVECADGYRRSEPFGAEWCRLAGLTLDEGAGARLVEAEEGAHVAAGEVQYGVAVALATINEAASRHRGASSVPLPVPPVGAVFARVTGDRREQHRGYFGEQRGRWCASGRDPSTRSLECWRLAWQLARAGHDFTGGARRWDAPETQDWLFRRGKVRFDAEGIVRKWGAEGWEVVPTIYRADGVTPLIDARKLALFRWVGKGRVDAERGAASVRPWASARAAGGSSSAGSTGASSRFTSEDVNPRAPP